MSRLAVTAAVLAGSAAQGETPGDADRTAVLAAAQAFFAAMESHDGARLRQLMLPEALLVSTADDDSKEPPRVSTADAFAERIGKSTEKLLERIWDPQVQVSGNLATLWAPYDFHRDGKLSHCGQDAFHLVRQNETWKIAVVSYTMVPAEQCRKTG